MSIFGELRGPFKKDKKGPKGAINNKFDSWLTSAFQHALMETYVLSDKGKSYFLSYKHIFSKQDQYMTKENWKQNITFKNLGIFSEGIGSQTKKL